MRQRERFAMTNRKSGESRLLDRSSAAATSRAETITRRLATRSRMEKALFDEGPVTLLMLFIPATVIALELTMNFIQGAGWSSTAHMLVMLPIELALIGLILRGIQSLVWQTRLKRLTRREIE